MYRVATNFMTARAAARHMVKKGAGVILMISASPARMAWISKETLLKRAPSLAEVGNVAVPMASDNASPMTGTAANMTCGLIVDWSSLTKPIPHSGFNDHDWTRGSMATDFAESCSL